jgi:hypothetical protein
MTSTMVDAWGLFQSQRIGSLLTVTDRLLADFERVWLLEHCPDGLALIL